MWGPRRLYQIVNNSITSPDDQDDTHQSRLTYKPATATFIDRKPRRWGPMDGLDAVGSGCDNQPLPSPLTNHIHGWLTQRHRLADTRGQIPSLGERRWSWSSAEPVPRNSGNCDMHCHGTQSTPQFQCSKVLQIASKSASLQGAVHKSGSTTAQHC